MKTGLSTTTLADQVEEKILGYIRDNNLGVGDSLPNEQQLCEMMGISRNILREAMSRLRMLGLLQSRTKRGIVITEPPLLNGFSKVLDPKLLSIKTIKELMGMRIVLEIGLTEFLFANVNDQDIFELEQIVLRHEAIGMQNLSVEDELIFHTRIYQIAGNHFLLQLNSLMHPVFVFAKQNYESRFLPIDKMLIEKGEFVKHSDLFSFIKNKDNEGYREAIRRHLNSYWEFVHNKE